MDVLILVGNRPGGGAIVLFNTTANVKPTRFAEYTWQRFIRDESLAENTFPEFCRPSSPNGPLLERLFDFAAPREPLERLESLRIVQTRGRYREIEFIGSQVADLLKDEKSDTAREGQEMGLGELGATAEDGDVKRMARDALMDARKKHADSKREQKVIQAALLLINGPKKKN